MINQEKIQVKNGSTWNKICPFPVGYVYLSSVNTSPASIYGGTWTQITGEWYLRAGTNFSQGGSNYISVQQMPAHSHVEVALVKKDSGNTTIPPWKLYINNRWASGGLAECNGGDEIKGSDADTDWGSTSSVGGGQPYYPPYQNVYVWYRTA